VQQIRSKRRSNPETWHKANRLVAVLIILGIAVVTALAFYPELRRLKSLGMQLDEEKAALAAEELLKERRTREVYLLQKDPEYVEIIARDKIGVMKPGETIFRDTPNSSP
jgi:cell division protein FtsB